MTVIDIVTARGLDLVEGAALRCRGRTAPAEALSATVSPKVMSQSTMRLSQISRAATAWSTAARTWSGVEDPVREVVGKDEGDFGLDPRLQEEP